VATALLPPPQPPNEGLVGSYLGDATTGLPDDQSFEEAEYSNRLTLDAVAPPSIGAGVGGPFGPTLSGGVGLFFSDMLGNQNLNVIVQANGTFRDIGGAVQYVNRANRYNWGGSFSHIPILQGGFAQYDPNPDNGTQADVSVAQILQRTFITGVDGFTTYPLTQTRRFEFNAGVSRYGDNIQAVDVRNRPGADVDDAFSRFDRGSDYLGRAGVSYVGDFSNFGFTSPLQGGRYRFGVTGNFGTEQFATVRLDYRRYVFRSPFTFAVRGLHVGNYGAQLDTDVIGFPIGQEFLAQPFQQGFVRGYSFNSIFDNECFAGASSTTEDACNSILNDVRGTRMALTTAEIRLPFLGTDQLGLLNFPYLPTEIVVFTDVGVAWTNEDLLGLRFENQEFSDGGLGATVGNPLGRDLATPLVSSGVSARVNVLGAMIMEFFYARTFQRQQDWDFGVLLVPGW
jgi:hypothetical protein